MAVSYQPVLRGSFEHVAALPIRAVITQSSPGEFHPEALAGRGEDWRVTHRCGSMSLITQWRQSGIGLMGSRFFHQLRGAACPSGGARRLAESAVLLVDDVFPEQPVRQWLLSFPYPLRFLFATRPVIMS